MEQRLTRYLQAISAAGAQTGGQIARLEAENRQDEANLEKVRRNVLEIFTALANADAAQARKDTDPRQAFERLHTQRLQQFPEPWRQKLQKAAAHGDVVARTIEQTKLDTVDRIRALFTETEADV